MSKEYFYPLYKEIDKQIYQTLVDSVSKPNFPELVGSDEELNEFLKLLIISGKMKKYRIFRDFVMDEFKKGKINLTTIVKQGQQMDIPKGIDESWAIFIQDKRICELIDEFTAANIQFNGTIEEKTEFIKRFLLSQLLQDWRGPKLVVLVEALEKKQIEVKELNVLLRLWDFTNIFKNK